MTAADDYRKRAKEIRAQAAAITVGTIKQQLGQVAEQFEALAREIECDASPTLDEELQEAGERQAAHDAEPKEGIAPLKPLPEPEKET